MGEIQIAMQVFPVWKSFLWFFYPIIIFLVFELISSDFDDDDDQDGGMMIPAYQGTN